MPLLRRLGWACGSVFAATVLLSLFYQRVGWTPAAIIVALAALAAARPFQGLLLLAGLGPLAAVLFVVVRDEPSAFRFEEAFTLAFLAGWMAHAAVYPQRLMVQPALRWCVTLLIAAAAASAVVNATTLIVEEPGMRAGELLWEQLARESLIASTPLTSTMLLIEGLLLVLIAAHACGGDGARRVQVLRMMVVGAGGAAVLNLLRLVTAAVQQEQPWASFLRFMATVRVNVHFADLNAAGSYFAMMSFIAAGLAVRARLMGPAGAVLIALGLWMSGSRIALAMAVVTAGAAGSVLAVRARTIPRRVSFGAILVLLGLATLAWWTWYPEGRNVDRHYALAFRVEMGKAGLQIAAAHPVWGVGPGRFYEASAQHASIPENAHNQYIQVLAELGIPGLLLFLAILALAFRECWRTSTGSGSLGLIAGLAAFLLTCIGGHPLLVPGAAYPFWLALGLAATPLAGIHALTRRARLAAVAVLTVFVVALPFRVRTAARSGYLEHASAGFSMWHRGPDGERFRWAGGQSTFFVASSARAVRVPLRAGPLAPEPLEVRILLDGREADRILLHSADEWRVLRLLLDRRESARFRRVDLHAAAQGTDRPLDVEPTNTSGVLMVGRPVIE